MRVLREFTAEEKAEFERIGAISQVAMPYLETSLEAAKNALVSLPAEQDFRVAQGQAQVLQHLLNAMKPGKR